MARSLFIVVLLVTGAYYLNRDSRNLVLLPIERMLQRLQVGGRKRGGGPGHGHGHGDPRRAELLADRTSALVLCVATIEPCASQAPCTTMLNHRLPFIPLSPHPQELADNPLAMAESRLQLQGPWQDRWGREGVGHWKRAGVADRFGA